MPQLSRLACALAVTLAAASAQAQVAQVRPAPQTSPSASARAALATPNPAGLRPLFPAGITSGSGAAVARDPVASSASPVGTNDAVAVTSGGTTANVAGMGGVVGGTNAPSAVDSGLYAPATNVLGAAGAGFAAGPAQTVGSGGAGVNAVDAARSFIMADANRDGELSRAEARRLPIQLQTFEEMDRNFDGIITRFEYDDSLR